jgi:hypothetical protein
MLTPPLRAGSALRKSLFEMDHPYNSAPPSGPAAARQPRAGGGGEAGQPAGGSRHAALRPLARGWVGAMHACGGKEHASREGRRAWGGPGCRVVPSRCTTSTRPRVGGAACDPGARACMHASCVCGGVPARPNAPAQAFALCFVLPPQRTGTSCEAEPTGARPVPRCSGCRQVWGSGFNNVGFRLGLSRKRRGDGAPLGVDTSSG